jgi:hypothetical protein
VQIAGFSGDPEQLLEEVVVGLHLGIGDAPILKKAAPHPPAQFVTLRRQLRLGGLAAVITAFEHQNVDTFRRQLPGCQGGGEAATDEHHGPAFQSRNHVRLL